MKRKEVRITRGRRDLDEILGPVVTLLVTFVLALSEHEDVVVLRRHVREAVLVEAVHAVLARIGDVLHHVPAELERSLEDAVRVVHSEVALRPRHVVPSQFLLICGVLLGAAGVSHGS